MLKNTMQTKQLTSLAIRIFMAFILSLSFAHNASAQEEPEIDLRLSRTFGYSSGTGDMQGTFKMKVTGPDTLIKVTFYLDETILAGDSQAPFELSFNTDSYPLGVHRLYAIGTAADGTEMHSREIKVNFVSAEEGIEAGLSFALPIFGLIIGIMVLSLVFSIFSGKKQRLLPPGMPRKYGTAGGTICPRCKRPYSLHFFAPNMIIGKFERCPFCGKWGVVKSYPIDVLRAAEQAEMVGEQSADESIEMSEEEKLRKELEESRYQGM